MFFDPSVRQSVSPSVLFFGDETNFNRYFCILTEKNKFLSPNLFLTYIRVLGANSFYFS